MIEYKAPRVSAGLFVFGAAHSLAAATVPPTIAIWRVCRTTNGRSFDIRKIERYCLDPEHPRGRHKARLFRELLGVTRTDSPWLRDALLKALRNSEAVALAADSFGTRWRVDVPISRQGNSIVVRTVWIVRTGEDVPRFVTCWVL